MMCSCEEFDHCYRCRCDWDESEKMIRDETAFPILFRHVHMIHGFSSPFSLDFCTMERVQRSWIEADSVTAFLSAEVKHKTVG